MQCIVAGASDQQCGTLSAGDDEGLCYSPGIGCGCHREKREAAVEGGCGESFAAAVIQCCVGVCVFVGAQELACSVAALVCGREFVCGFGGA
ncbi:hypothetical protein BDZ97DRAFT_139518 [Flammula alnicola]|nr:hypothetical protein BDZ97DRAFT_191178 [Flammula alnicola]KAF8957013.1 hypothetical protein BDZ97DRAFT_139518 [Flammula alnicola]